MIDVEFSVRKVKEEHKLAQAWDRASEKLKSFEYCNKSGYMRTKW
jgi:hypothetical protein